MKIKLLNVVLLVVSLLGCALGLFACAEKRDNDTHTHSYVNYEYNYDATCVKDGTETGRCEICGKTDTRTSNEHLRTGEHQYENGVCKICGATENLVVRDYNTVTFNPNGGSCSVENKQFEVGKVMQELPTPILNGYRFKGWYDVYDELYDTTSVMPNRALSLTARWEKIVSTYSDSYVSLKPATSGVKSSNHRYFGVDACVYVEIKSTDLKGGVGTDNNFTLRTLEGMEYSVKDGYTWIWYYDDSFSSVNGAQRFSLNYGSNLQFVTVNNSSGVTVKTYLVNIYVLHDYYISLYKTIYDSNSYTRVKVVENDYFSESTATASLGNFEFDKRVYYNENVGEYVEFDYSTAITKDWNLYQTYKPVTMQVELNGGTIEGDDEIIIAPYTQYLSLPVPQKDGYDFLGWKMDDEYYANLLGYAGANYITSTTATSTLTAVFEQKKYHYTFKNDTLNTYRTVPVVTYADETMSQILELLYVPYNTDCALPTITPQKAGNVFYEWSVRSSETNALVPFDFNTKITNPVALIASTVPSEYSGTTLPLNKEVSCSQTGTYSVYLPTASRYTLNVTTTGSVAFTVNAYGSATAKDYTVSSTSPVTVNLDYYTYNLGVSKRTVGYVTFNVTSRSGSFKVSVQGATGETEGTPMTVNATNLVDLGEEFAISEQVVCADKSGYTFVGWYNGETELTKELSYTFTISSENITYAAKWIKVTIARGDTTAGTITTLTDIYRVGDSATVTATTDIGYTFVGWYNGETELTKELSYTFTMPTENATFTAKWIRVTIDQNYLSAGTVAELTDTFKVGDSATVTATTNIGYTFVGWYNGETELTKELSYTFTMPSEDITYTAKWSINNEMSNFKFVSTTTTLNITDIINNEVTTIIVPDYVTSISQGAFSGCENLTDITLPYVGSTKESTSKTFFGYIFGASAHSDNENYVPASLKNVIITGDMSIGDYAFYKCSSLTSIEMPDSVTSIGSSAFENCSNLTSIVIPNSVTSIGDYAFYKCSSLTSIEMPDSVTSIGNDAFYKCSSLTSIEIPNRVTSIGDSAFCYCSSLTSIEIPNSVTSIGNAAFAYCSKLTSIKIPNSVTSIGGSVFFECYHLTIYCEVASEPSGWDSNWNNRNYPVVWDYKNQQN